MTQQSRKRGSLENGKITKEQYDEWRYKYPELDAYEHWAKVPSQAISDMLLTEESKPKKKSNQQRKKK